MYAEMKDFQYCEQILPKVSRTFALNIAVLRGEIHRSVLLSYLWCRILDTVEDATSFATEAKVKALGDFESLFAEPSIDRNRLGGIVRSLRSLDGDPDELDLLRNADRVAVCHNDLSDRHRSVITASLMKMAKGMAHFQSRDGFSRTGRLEDEVDLDRYCYVVAGTVGEMLTDLFLLERPMEEARALSLKSLGVSFGLGLQLTNIAKDLLVDLERGWCYFPRSLLAQARLDVDRDEEVLEQPWRRGLVLLLPKCLRHLRDAFSYVIMLPTFARRMRLFCIWPLWLAIHTLELMSRPAFRYQPGVSPKLTRDEVKSILRRTSLFFWSNSWLTTDFGRTLETIEERLAAEPACSLPPPPSKPLELSTGNGRPVLSRTSVTRLLE